MSVAFTSGYLLLATLCSLAVPSNMTRCTKRERCRGCSTAGGLLKGVRDAQTATAASAVCIFCAQIYLIHEWDVHGPSSGVCLEAPVNLSCQVLHAAQAFGGQLLAAHLLEGRCHLSDGDLRISRHGDVLVSMHSTCT
jgi:hypothetical protein